MSRVPTLALAEGLELDESSRLVAGPLQISPPPAAVPTSGFWVEIADGSRLWSIDTGGDGDAVVLLHSGVGHLGFWAYQIPALVAAGFRVLAYDRRGHGRSLDIGSSANTDAEDLTSFATALGIERFHLIGTAQGGRVANDVAVSSPSALLSLAIVSSLAGVLPAGAPLIPDGFGAMPVEFRELGPAYRALDPGGVRRWLEKHNEGEPGPAPVRPGQRRDRITPAELRTLHAPTLLATGDADPYAPPTSYRELRSYYRRSRLVVFSECGHSAFWERPDLFNRVLISFLRDPTGFTAA